MRADGAQTGIEVRTQVVRGSLRDWGHGSRRVCLVVVGGEIEVISFLLLSNRSCCDARAGRATPSASAMLTFSDLYLALG